MATLSVSTDERLELREITDSVAAELPADHDGIATVFVEHTTAGLLVNEAEPRLLSDLEEFFADLVADDGWEHDRLDGNADSHLRAGLVGPSVTVPVEAGDLRLGTWQSILLLECDGPRSRTVRVTPIE